MEKTKSLLPLRTRSARQRMVNPRKVYAIDPGLAAAMYRAGSINQGAQLENAVYLELRRRYGRLSEGVLGWYKTASGREVDFAIDDPVRGGPPELVQVSVRMDTPATREREITALVEAMEETGCEVGKIITLVEDEQLKVSAGQIRILPARAFFLRPPPPPGALW